jgi:SAM-dependent methyltransferase
MRAKATAALGASPAFWAIAGTAENTGLPAASVDLVVCAQAFHWFRLPEASVEFRRILKPGGVIAVMWNLRQRQASAFVEGIESLLYEYCPTYAEHVFKDTEEAVVNVQKLSADVRGRIFEWADPLDREALLGRMLSASYVPMEGDANRAVLEGLNQLFDEHQHEGRVAMVYQTKLFWTK